MSRPLRVAHLPARTPYVRKIVADDYGIVNATATRHGTVPAALTAQWLLDRRPFDWFDVLHLHHVEFDEPVLLERVLSACDDAGVRIVFTLHDVWPLFTTIDDYRQRLRLIAGTRASWIGLTAASVDALPALLDTVPPVTVIPHGYVVSPDDLAPLRRATGRNAPVYLMYGALRPNREHLATLANWSLFLTDPDVRLRLLLRGLSPIDFSANRAADVLGVVRADRRIEVTMRAYPTDREVVDAGLRSDALLLPYLHASHSGQLEFAFDLNLLPVCSSVGFLKDQYERHKALVAEPVWIDWSDCPPFLLGERFVAALAEADAALAESGPREVSADFLAYRREEHCQFLDAHRAIYNGESIAS